MNSKRGSTLVVPIIGDPVAQVATPDLWNREFLANGIDAICVPIHLKPSGLLPFIDWVRYAENVPGFLSTIPHKKDLAQLCDYRRSEVDVVGAANAVRKNKDGTLECAMFDGVGMVNAIQLAGADFEAACVHVIGAGAAGSAIAYEALQCGAKQVSMKDPCSDSLARLAATLKNIFPDRTIQMDDDENCSYQIIINASPMGSYATDPLPCQLSADLSKVIVADAVTEPANTSFLTLAKQIGLQTVSGKEMAAAQASHMQHYLGISAKG